MSGSYCFWSMILIDDSWLQMSAKLLHIHSIFQYFRLTNWNTHEKTFRSSWTSRNVWSSKWSWNAKVCRCLNPLFSQPTSHESLSLRRKLYIWSHIKNQMPLFFRSQIFKTCGGGGRGGWQFLAEQQRGWKRSDYAGSCIQAYMVPFHSSQTSSLWHLIPSKHGTTKSPILLLKCICFLGELHFTLVNLFQFNSIYSRLT